MATGDLYINPGTTISFKSSGGEATFTPTSLASDAGRQSAFYNIGTGARPQMFEYMARTKVATAGVVGEIVEMRLCLAGASAANPENDVSGDAGSFAEAKLQALKTILLPIFCHDTSTGVEFVSRGKILIAAEQVAINWWNRFTNALSSTATDHEFTLKPIPFNEQ